MIHFCYYATISRSYRKCKAKDFENMLEYFENDIE